MQQSAPRFRRPDVPRALRRATLGLVCGLVLAPRPAAAQDAADQVDRWAATAELTLTDASGNQDVSVITSAFSLRHRKTEDFAFELRLQARYGSSNHERVAESYKGSLNVDLSPAGRWSPFMFSAAERDPFRRLDVRLNSGAGAKYRLYRAENRGEAAFSMAVLHSYEDLADPGITRSARWRMNLNGRQRIGEGLTLSHKTEYQPVYDAPSDYLLTLETGLRVLVTRRVALSVSHEFNRDSTPAPGVEADDRLLKAGVIVEL